MEESTTRTARLDPRRAQVFDIVTASLAHADPDNAAQIIADMITATSIVGCIIDADLSAVQPIFNSAKGDAEKAASHIIAST